MLYAHGPDLCRESDLRHAMANCFEALIGEIPPETKRETPGVMVCAGDHKENRGINL